MRLSIIAILIGAAAALPASADVLAVVDGTPVTAQDVKLIRDEMTKGAPKPIRSRSALARMSDIALLSAVERKALASSARKSGLDRDPDVLLRLEAVGSSRTRRDQVLKAAWMADVDARISSPSDEKLEAFYDHAVTAPRYRLRFLHFADASEASLALKKLAGKAEFETALASRIKSKTTFKDADVLNYGRPAFDTSPPVMQLFLAASDWAWRQVGLDIGAGAIGTIGGPMCEGLICSLWMIDDIETSPPRPFDELSAAEKSTLTVMRADIAARAVHAEALRSAGVTWKTTIPAGWNSILARPAFTEE
ncbi:hypothetical protein [Bosea sp. RAC05]|uniref:hypothetical protein n=1 Tax=Bosea sp. RAC05 TaxID=1842539 RepID=UPI000856F808|nr:hypothetical protein [Bosea sp. RAC05]AOG03374.1 hypothetical protein BSY19_5063 [Bosea sp. RAC05]